VNCPICERQSSHYFKSKTADYYQCRNCYLVFVPKSLHLESDEEKLVYDKHQNDPNDHRYRDFLAKVSVPLSQILPKNSKGLDFGSGPGPTLNVMMEELGFEMEIYDKFYQIDGLVLSKTYDFITCTEVVEHFDHPLVEIQKLHNILKPSGVLAIMTGIYDEKDFSSWRYKNDPTHISLFSAKTFQFISQQLNCRLQRISETVFFLFKSEQ
jgi:SAM-dependent methyltransferase